jgi:hypothetical protein
MTVDPGLRQFQLTSSTGDSVLRVVNVPTNGGIMDVGAVETSTGAGAFYVIGTVAVLGAEIMAPIGLVLKNPSDDDKKSNSPQTLASWDNTGTQLLVAAGISAGAGALCFVAGALLPRDFGINLRPSTQVAVAGTPDSMQVTLRGSY